MAQPNIPFDTTTAPKLASEEAFEKTLPEIEAMPDTDLVPVNIDVIGALTTVTGCLPEIKAMRPSIEAEWKNFDLARFDRLEQYTLALAHAHAQYRVATTPKAAVPELAAELTKLRDRMLTDAQALANHGLIDGSSLSKVKTASGYRALADDVLALHAAFKDAWSKIEGKTPYTLDDLQRAGNGALELISAVGLRAQTPLVAGTAVTNRLKAFTLFIRAYDDARRAVHYLRHQQEDADQIAPSLYQGRGTRRRADDTTPPVPTTTPESAANKDSTPHAATPSDAARTPAPPIVIHNPTNLPVGNPYTS